MKLVEYHYEEHGKHKVAPAIVKVEGPQATLDIYVSDEDIRRGKRIWSQSSPRPTAFPYWAPPSGQV